MHVAFEAILVSRQRFAACAVASNTSSDRIFVGFQASGFGTIRIEPHCSISPWLLKSLMTREIVSQEALMCSPISP